MNKFLDYEGLAHFTSKMENIFQKPNKISIQLSVDEWEDNHISISSLYASTNPKYIYLTAASPDTLDIYNGANVKMLDVEEDGIFTFVSKAALSSNIFVNILRLEVSSNENS